MANNHRYEKPVSFVTVPNGGKLPKWADGTIGWNGREELHREYLKQNKFKNLDQYDEQVIHDRAGHPDVEKSDVEQLKDEIDLFERLSYGPFTKDRHITDLISNITQRKSVIDSQLKYMETNKMSNSELYKQLLKFSQKLEAIKTKLNNELL